jgi:hypothetical protein
MKDSGAPCGGWVTLRRVSVIVRARRADRRRWAGLPRLVVGELSSNALRAIVARGRRKRMASEQSPVAAQHAQEQAAAELEQAARQFVAVEQVIRRGDGARVLLQARRAALEAAAQAFCQAHDHAPLS